MRVLIVGASKGIGLETARQALDRGHDVRAFARSAAAMPISNPRLEKIGGDALRPEDVEAALAGMDVVIQTLGIGFGDLFRPVSLFSDATRVLIAAAKRQGVERAIFVTGFGAGASRASIGRWQRLPFQIVFGRAYADKSAQEEAIERSGLDWTIARPGVLTNGPRTGRYRIRFPRAADRGPRVGSEGARSGQLTIGAEGAWPGAANRIDRKTRDQRKYGAVGGCTRTRTLDPLIKSKAFFVGWQWVSPEFIAIACTERTTSGQRARATAKRPNSPPATASTAPSSPYR
jgi:putative NADH-flavin reductase